ncbi:MAG: MogA/MoaB family molybdenum cofactor biosynthesis protein [Actinobacteria bacterium]|nr:MogA/MoaB family molybdenum cofactor biosynthesis protein [Actinomycetota bacterium]
MGVDGPAARVITVSDGVSGGARDDLSGEALAEMLSAEGYVVTRDLVPDELAEISQSIRRATAEVSLIVTTGGTGFGPRDVTPEATLAVLEREAPGLVQAMVAAGLESTPLAALSRARAGSVGACLVVNVPGSPRGATESLQAIIGVLPHALRLLAGDTGHH